MAAIKQQGGCSGPNQGWGLPSQNTIAYPLQGTIEYVKEIGLETRFIEMCCSLIY
jgi:hypothetical protein